MNQAGIKNQLILKELDKPDPGSVRVGNELITATFRLQKKYEVTEALANNRLIDEFTHPVLDPMKSIKDFTECWGFLWYGWEIENSGGFLLQKFFDWQSYYIALCFLSSDFYKKKKAEIENSLHRLLKAKAKIDSYNHVLPDLEQDVYFQRLTEIEKNHVFDNEFPRSLIALLTFNQWPKDVGKQAAILLANEFNSVHTVFDTVRVNDAMQIAKRPLMLFLTDLLIWHLSQQHERIDFGVCEHCRKEFLVTRSDKKYCRDGCRTSEAKKRERQKMKIRLAEK